MTDTYAETVLRFRVMRHEELPETHKQAYIADGRNPDDMWGLIWSFSDLASAEKCLEEEKAHACSWQTYKLVDAGKEEVIQRSIY